MNDTLPNDGEIKPEAGSPGASDTPPGAAGSGADPASPPSALDGAAPPAPPPPSDPPAAQDRNWREEMAGGDQKLLSRLGRYKDPAALAKAWQEADRKINSGEVRPVPKEGATDEERAAYREAMGVPAEPTGYEVALSGGLSIGEDDQPRVQAFLEAAHGTDMTPAQVNGALDWYYAEQDNAAAQQAEADRTAAEETTVALREKYGADYLAVNNSIKALLGSADEATYMNLMNARLGDGSMLGNNVAVLDLLADAALKANPIARLIPNADSNPAQSVDEELAELRKFMQTDRDAYFKDSAKQERYRSLIDAKSKLEAR